MQNWKVKKRFFDDEEEDEEDLPLILVKTRADKPMKPPSQDKKCHRFKDKLKIEAIKTAREWLKRDLRQPKYTRYWYH